MAAAIVVPAQLEIRQPLVVTGSGFALTHAYTFNIKNPEMVMELTYHGTTDGTGAFTTSGILDLDFTDPGFYVVTVNDGTSTVTGTVEVFEA